MPLFDAEAISPAHHQHAFTSSDDQFACLRRGKSINSTRVLPRTGSAHALVGPEAVASRRARHDGRPTTAAAAGPSVDRAGAHVGGGEAAPALRPVHSLYRGRPVWVPKPPRQTKRSATSLALEIALEKLKHGPSPVHPEEIPRLMGFEIPRLPRGSAATDSASSSASSASSHQLHARDNPFDRTNAAGSPSPATPAAPFVAIATGGGSRGNVARVGTLGGRGQSPTSATSAHSPGSSSPSSGRRSPGSRGGFRPKKRAGQTGRTEDMMDRPIISSAGLGLGKPLYNAAHGDASMVGFVKVRESPHCLRLSYTSYTVYNMKVRESLLITSYTVYNMQCSAAMIDVCQGGSYTKQCAV